MFSPCGEWWEARVGRAHECVRVWVKDEQLYSFPDVTQPQNPQHKHRSMRRRGPPPHPDAIRGTGGSLSNAAELRLLGQCPLSEHAMTEITVMQLSRQGGPGMLGSTCCTDAHKC